MKATLFKEVGYSLSKLIEDIDMGEIGLPDIQGPFVWKPAKVRDLFDSMYKGFPGKAGRSCRMCIRIWLNRTTFQSVITAIDHNFSQFCDKRIISGKTRAMDLWNLLHFGEMLSEADGRRLPFDVEQGFSEGVSSRCEAEINLFQFGPFGLAGVSAPGEKDNLLLLDCVSCLTLSALCAMPFAIHLQPSVFRLSPFGTTVYLLTMW